MAQKTQLLEIVLQLRRPSVTIVTGGSGRRLQPPLDALVDWIAIEETRCSPHRETLDPVSNLIDRRRDSAGQALRLHYGFVRAQTVLENLEIIEFGVIE